MRHLLAREGLDGRVEVDSAGTGSWHVGDPPDRRATAEARARGIVMEGRARQFRAVRLRALRPAWWRWTRRTPPTCAPSRPTRAAAPRSVLLRDWDPEARDGDRSVPDPYYGGPEGFADVLDMIERACAGLIAEVRAGPLAGA